MYVCLYLCVDDEAAPAGLGFGKDDDAKTQEEGAKSDGIGRWEIFFVESRDGRRKDGCKEEWAMDAINFFVLVLA